MQIISDLKIAQKAIAPDEDNNDLEGYYCIQTVAYQCYCRPKPWTFIHCKARIIVWPNKDDNSILEAASEFKKIQLDPRIVEYKSMMGKAIEYDDIPNGATIG